MPQPSCPPHVIVETLQLVIKHGGNIAAAAREANVPLSTFRGRYKVLQDIAASKNETLAQEERNRYINKVDTLRGQVRTIQSELSRSQDLKEAIFKMVSEDIDPPSWITKLAAKSTKVPSIPILLASDFQWGEEIKSYEMDGVNEFNATVASKRYKKLIDSAIELCSIHMGQHHQYPGIIYARLGDMISGDIHQELRETNDLQSIPAVKDLVEHEIAGIEKLADAFGKVHVVSTPGNHGRTTIKPFAKKFVETNYDTLSAWWIESHFKTDKRVTFQTPLSGDALVQVYGWTWLLTHGDRIGSNGGEGHIGPAATIARGMKKTIDYYATMGTIIHCMCVGHFHTRMELEWGFSNGSLPGLSEYAKSGRFTPAAPSQWLLIVHPDKGVTARWPIFLGDKPKIAKQNKSELFS